MEKKILFEFIEAQFSNYEKKLKKFHANECLIRRNV